MPAPVYNIKVEPSKTWAIVTWDIITVPERSSYITHYEIYTNQTFREIIHREDQRTQYNMTDLTPYSYYSVGIKAVDGSSQTSQTKYRAFRTNEAGRFTRIMGGGHINNLLCAANMWHVCFLIFTYGFAVIKLL